MVWSVILEKAAEKDLKKAPSYIVLTFNVWRLQVIELGLPAVQGKPGMIAQSAENKSHAERELKPEVPGDLPSGVSN